MVSFKWNEMYMFIGLSIQNNSMAFCSSVLEPNKQRPKIYEYALVDNLKEYQYNSIDHLRNCIMEYIFKECDTNNYGYNQKILNVYLIDENDTLYKSLNYFVSGNYKDTTIKIEYLKPRDEISDNTSLICSYFGDDYHESITDIKLELYEHDIYNIMLKDDRYLPKWIAFNYSMGEILNKRLSKTGVKTMTTNIECFEMELYIGISLQKTGMAFCVSGFVREQELALITYLFHDEKVSINKLTNELKNYISKVCINYPNIRCEKYLHLFIVNKSNIVEEKLKQLKYDGLNRDVQIYKRNIEPLCNPEESIGLIMSCINDGNLRLDKDVDIDVKIITEEIDNAVLENQNLTPIMTALNYSLGEMLYRRLSNQEVYIQNSYRFRVHTEAMINVFSRMSGRW